MPKAPKTSLLFNKVSSKFEHGRVGDLVDAYNLFIYCALIGLGLSLVFLILICMCTTMITWILLLGLVVVLFAFGVFVLINLYWTGPLNDGVNAARVKYLSFIFKYKTNMTVGAIIIILLGFVLLYLICKFKKYVKTAIPILALASKASLKNVLLIILSTVTIFV